MLGTRGGVIIIVVSQLCRIYPSFMFTCIYIQEEYIN